jgi:hypothetical protein
MEKADVKMMAAVAPTTIAPFTEDAARYSDRFVLPPVMVLTNQLLPPNQRLETMGKQPTRFSGRRADFPMQNCLTSVAAARLFFPLVCMSSNAVDLSLLKGGETPTMTQWKNEAVLTIGAPFSIPNVDIFNSKSTPFSMFFTDAAIRIRTGQFCQISASAADGKTTQPRWRAFKLATTGHVAIALWDLSDGILEVFDSGGSAHDNVHTQQQEQLIRHLFTKYPGPPFSKLRFTNFSSLQTDASDRFCQTWIYWYLYERVINKHLPEDVIQLAKKLTKEERLNTITNFWHFLASKT